MSKVKDLSDEKVVEVVRSQSKHDYKVLVDRYEEKLLSYATYMVRDEQAAQDVVQNAFIKAYQNLMGFNVKKKFSSWIYRIVHNEAINEIKRNKKLLSLESNTWVLNISDSGNDIVTELGLKETKEMVKNNVKKLPLKYREPLALFYMQDYTYEQISDILRIPVSTVGTRIKRAKVALAKIIKGDR